MKRFASIFQQLNEDKLAFILAFLGALLAWHIIYIQQGWVNVDSLIYFEAARLFSIGEWKHGVETFKWPLYSLLISTVERFTHLSIQVSAQLLDMLFFAITTFSFAKLIQLTGGNKITILCGVFLLFSSSYIVGDVLPMLLRDQGFWAAFLTSLVFFIRFHRTNKLNDALLWQISAIIAMLFRIEAITFLACMPMLVMIRNEYSLREKFKQFIMINMITMVSLFLIVGMLITIPSVTLSDFGRLKEAVTIFPRMLTDIALMFTNKAQIMGEQVLGYYFADYGLMGVILTLVAILSLKIINIITLPVISIFYLSYINRHTLPPLQKMLPDARKVFYWANALALLNAVVIIVQVFVLSNRYIISLGFIILIFAAFCLAPLVQALFTKSIKKQWQKILLLLVLLALSFSFIKNLLPKKDGYNYEQDAVNYVKQLSIPNNEIFFSTPRSGFYAGEKYQGRCIEDWPCIQKAVNDGRIKRYNYLMINLEIDEKTSDKEKYLAKNLQNFVIDKEFYGIKHKKKMVVYVRK